MVLMLSILVVLHEFGHFLPAKLFKVRVEKFYLFMDAGFSLFKKKIKDTEWGIGWLPIGGYVKLAGMIDESMDTEALKQAPKPYEFRSKPAWQRLIIMLGGVTVNIILAWFIYTLMFSTYGQKYIATDEIEKNGFAFGQPLLEAGFKNGDKIKSIDGVHQPKFNRFIIDFLLGDTVEVIRGNETLKITLNDTLKRDILKTEGRQFAMPRTESVVDSIPSNSNAKIAGLQVGDKIIGVNNQSITYHDEVSSILKSAKKDSASLVVLRGKDSVQIHTKLDKEFKIGFVTKSKDLKEKYLIVKKHSFFQAIPLAAKECYMQFTYSIKQLKLLIKPKTEAWKHIKSPIGITDKLIPSTWDWEYFWNFTAMFSIGLAFMNLLPIPGLDGAHALFTIAEMITGRTLSDKAMGVVQTVGMVILLSLMAFTFGKDIYDIILENIR